MSHGCLKLLQAPQIFQATIPRILISSSRFFNLKTKKRNGRKKFIENFNLLVNKSKPVLDTKLIIINNLALIHFNKMILNISLILKNPIVLHSIVNKWNKKSIISSIKNKKIMDKFQVIETAWLKAYLKTINHFLFLKVTMIHKIKFLN